MRLIVGPGLCALSRATWRIFAAADLREFRLPEAVVFVGPLSDEDKESMRRMWPIAKRSVTEGWCRLSKSDVVLCTASEPAPAHSGPRVTIHATEGQKEWDDEP